MTLNLETLGRWGLMSLFILGGLHKTFDSEVPLRLMANAGLGPGPVLLPMVIALELIGGLVVARGGRFAAPTALVLAIYTMAVNYFMHPFWSLSGHEREQEIALFFKNVAIAGALVMVAGRLSTSTSKT